MLFWQTKSQTQPVAGGLARSEDGVYEEARRFERAAFRRLKGWANKGLAYSTNRPGSWADRHYRHLMKEI